MHNLVYGFINSAYSMFGPGYIPNFNSENLLVFRNESNKMKFHQKYRQCETSTGGQILILVPINTASAGFEFVYELKFFPPDSLWGTLLNQ